MVQQNNEISWIDSEDNNQHPDLDSSFSEEEDDGERGLIVEEEARCPNCTSSLLERHVTKGGNNVIRCKVCGTLLCPHCMNALPKVRSSGRTQEKLQCKKCGADL